MARNADTQNNGTNCRDSYENRNGQNASRTQSSNKTTSKTSNKASGQSSNKTTSATSKNATGSDSYEE